MRKRVFKRKKKTMIHSKALAFAAAMSLMLGMVITVYGQEMGGEASSGVLRTVVTDILHKHIGNPDTEGGCYTSPIAHVHKGDEVNGGGCYTKPVPHTHTGSSDAGGGCYGQEIPHTTHDPECYTSETHTHESSCLGGVCTITYTETGVIGTYTDYCRIHGDTTFERRSAIAFHSSCGLGEVDAIREICQSCTNSLTRTHTYIDCGKQEGTTSVLTCSKTIDGYEINCGHEEGAAERYERECSNSVDGYGIGCGLEEDKPCGKLVLTSQTGSDDTKVMISVKVEDLSGGKLILSSDPYIWRDQEGNLLGTGESLEVDKNGDYFVTVSLENKDVDESGLQSSISVDNIQNVEPQKPTATPTASVSPSPDVAPTATPSASPEETPKRPKETPEAPKETPEVPKETSSATVSPIPSAEPEHSPESTAVPEHSPVPEHTPEPTVVPGSNLDKNEGDKEEGDKNGEEDGAQEEDSGNEKITGAVNKENLEEKQAKENSLEDGSEQESNKASYYKRRGQSEKEENQVNVSPSPTPKVTSKEKVKKETEVVTVSGNMAAEDRQYKPGQTKKGGFFQSAAVKVLTVTVSSILILGGIILLLLYLMCSVRVYNDDGTGRMIYLGRCLIRKKEEEYSLMITEAMTEKSCTNRYCIKPGLFRLGKKEGQELIVYRDTRKAAVLLEREMIVIL